MSYLRAALCAGLLSVAASGEVSLAQPVSKDLNIEPQPLDKAIADWARQTQFQVLIAAKPEEARATPAVRGGFSPEGALRMLLADSGYTYRVVNSKTVAIVPRQAGERDESESRRGIHLAAGPQQSGSVAAADAATEDRRALQEVIVTAQKREERALDVPMSLVAVGSSELERRDVSNLNQLAFAVPGLAVESSGTNSRIHLRGISNVSGFASLVGLYLDEASATSAAFSQLDLRTYDLDRIEVLRGPQGTLYGEGSVGGTIRFITKNPVLDEFDAQGEASMRFVEDGDSGERIQAMVNVPLVTNVLGLRIGGEYNHGGGWIDQPVAGKKDINGEDMRDLRVKGLWQPTTDLSVNAMAVIHRDTESQSTGEDGNGNFTQVFGLTTTPRVDNDYDLYHLSATYDLPSVHLIALASNINQSIDTSNSGGRLQLAPPPAERFQTYAPLDKRDVDIKTQEVRATSRGDGRLDWTLGATHRQFQFAEDAPVNYFGFPGAIGLPAFPYAYTVDSESRSWALFGDANYGVTDRLRLGAGLRYFHDSQDYFTTGVAPQSGDFHSLNPRVYTEFKIVEDWNAYASAAKGFRSGGFNLANQPSYGPESVWTYEIGTKALTLNNRLTAEFAIFYSDYKDYQIFGQLLPPNPPLAITSNAGRARSEGVEWSFAWRVSDEWRLLFNGTWGHSEFYEINATSTSHEVGDQLDLFPKFTATASAERDFHLYGQPGFARLDFGYHGREVYRNRSVGPWYYGESDLVRILNFNTGLNLTSGMYLSLYAQNILNNRGYTAPLAIEDGSARAQPRTYGVTVGFTFK